MSDTTDSILKEAAKPASGFLSAILEPKIEKVKLWAKEKDLKGDLDPSKLSKIMEEYLTKLAHRVSELTSIAFPLLKLKIEVAYEPLALEILHPSNEENPSFDIIRAIVQSNGSFIIIDSAGMGKSTFSKYLVGQFLLKCDRIPVFFELRKATEDKELLENLAEEFNLPGNTLTTGLFYKLLKLGKFIVILDGFDEVAIEHQETLAQQINDLSIKGGSNSLILTSRPQDKLPDLMHGKLLRFKLFTLTQAKSLALRYDSISNLDIGKRLIGELDKIPAKFIETPLLVSLLYKTYGVNNSIADRVCTFYDEIYHALYKGHDLLNKNGYGREKKSELDFEDFRRLLRALCYYMAINRKASFNSWSEAISFIDKASAISSIIPKTSSKYLDDLLVSVPLMSKDGTEYKFSHKTILEYFSAEYLVYNQNSFDLVTKIFNSKMAESFEKTFEFLNDINPSLFESVITKYYADRVVKSDIGQTLNEKTLNTLNFVMETVIGIWRKSEYTEKFNDGQSMLSSKAHDSAPLGHEHTATWCNITINDEDYYLAFAFNKIYSNFYELTWLALTEEVQRENMGVHHAAAINSDGLEEYLGLNTWSPLIGKLIDDIAQYESVYLFGAKVLQHERMMSDNGTRILSKNKASEIIGRINNEKKLEDEMNSFLQ